MVKQKKFGRRTAGEKQQSPSTTDFTKNKLHHQRELSFVPYNQEWNYWNKIVVQKNILVIRSLARERKLRSLISLFSIRER